MLTVVINVGPTLTAMAVNPIGWKSSANHGIMSCTEFLETMKLPPL